MIFKIYWILKYHNCFRLCGFGVLCLNRQGRHTANGMWLIEIPLSPSPRDSNERKEMRDFNWWVDSAPSSWLFRILVNHLQVLNTPRNTEKISLSLQHPASVAVTILFMFYLGHSKYWRRKVQHTKYSEGNHLFRVQKNSCIVLN